MYESRNDDADLGLLPVAGALPAVGSVISAIGGIFGGSDNTGRFRTNLELYNAAIAGDTVALEKLRQKSLPGGWATKEATNDAKQKYASALQILGSRAAPQPGAYASPVAQASFLGGVSPLILGGAALAVFTLSQSTRSKRR